VSAAAAELCAAARVVLRASPSSLAHRRGCAFVARQSIESAVRLVLGSSDSLDATWRSRFLLLEFLESSNGLPSAQTRRRQARQGYLLWQWWSGLCHYGSYDLLPFATDIEDRLSDTAAWLADFAAVGAGTGMGVE
jgi:hypothetical protein